MNWSRYIVIFWLVSVAIVVRDGRNAPPLMGVKALDWSDWATSVVMGSSSDASPGGVAETLSMEEIMEMRVRDLKRRLARQHGYSAEELGRMIDKKELIQALAFEEEKVRLESVQALQRTVLHRGILWALVAIVITILWPVIQQGKDVLMVNVVVYTDRKTHEVKRCWELHSPLAAVGVAIMLVLDLLQAWLYLSVLLSWFISRNAYFFPIPNIPIRPADFMGGDARKAFGGYGINVGSMAVTWGLRFVHGRVEGWTGRVMLKAQKKLRKEEKRQQKQQQKQQQQQQSRSRNIPSTTANASHQDSTFQPQQGTFHDESATAQNRPPSSLPPQWMEPIIVQEEELVPIVDAVTSDTFAAQPPTRPNGQANPPVPVSDTHRNFLQELETNNSNTRMGTVDETDWDDVMGELD